MKLLLFSFQLFLIINGSKIFATELRRIERSISVEGITRKYVAFIPKVIIQGKRYKAVIAFHPRAATTKYMESTMNFHNESNIDDFVFAYPQGMYKSWNGTRCCGNAHKKNIDDILFVKFLIKDLNKIIKIRPKVFITGFSNGSVFSFRLSCEEPGLIAGAALFGATSSSYKNCKPGSHPFLYFHGENDKISSTGFNSRKVKKTFKEIGKRNNCNISKSKNIYNPNLKTNCLEYKSCSATTQMCLIHDLGHSWPGTSVKRRIFRPSRPDLKGNSAVMEFFKEIKF